MCECVTLEELVRGDVPVNHRQIPQAPPLPPRPPVPLPGPYAELLPAPLWGL